MTEQIEKWEKIKGYNGRYLISNTGRVLSTDRHTILKLKDSARYLKVNLRKYHSRKTKTYLVHRLVAEHFLSNYREDLTVNHIDGNRNNNNSDNLEMISSISNIYDYSFRNANYGVYKTKYDTYNARFQINGKRRNLGCFRTFDEAQSAYDKEHKKHYGEHQ